MRQIADHFDAYNVTTFHEYYPFADQYLELKPALFRNCLLAVVCMWFVAFIMIPNVVAGLAIVVSIISIDLGECVLYQLKDQFISATRFKVV